MTIAIVGLVSACIVWFAFQVFLVRLDRHVTKEAAAEKRAWNELVHGGICDAKDPGGVLRQAREILASHSARRSAQGASRN